MTIKSHMTPDKVAAIARKTYPSGRAANAAQRVYTYCGLWPHELVKGFAPEFWGIKLCDELATLIRLTVEAPDIELDDVLKRLEDLASKHDGPASMRLNRADVADVRTWLRLEKGVDTNQPRPSSGNTVPQRVDEQSGAQSQAEPEIHAEIIVDPHGPNDIDSDSSSSDETEVDEEATEEETVIIDGEQNELSNNQATPKISSNEPIAMLFHAEPRSTTFTQVSSFSSRDLARPNAQPSIVTSTNPAKASSTQNERVNDMLNAHYQESVRKAALSSRVLNNYNRSKAPTASRPPRNSESFGRPPDKANQGEPPSIKASPLKPESQAIKSPIARPKSTAEAALTIASRERLLATPAKAVPDKINAQPTHPIVLHAYQGESNRQGRAALERLTTDAAPKASPASRLSLVDTNQREPANVAVSVRSDGHSSISSTGSDSIPAVPRPRRNIKLPSRYVDDAPLSAVSSRKRPTEHISPSTSETRTMLPTKSSFQLSEGINASSSTDSGPQSSSDHSSLPSLKPSWPGVLQRNATAANPSSQSMLRQNSLPSVALSSQSASRNTPLIITETSPRMVPDQRVQSPNATMARKGSWETVGHPPVKKQKVTDAMAPSILADGTFDFDGTLPTGKCFLAELRNWLCHMEPCIEKLDRLLRDVLDESRRLKIADRAQEQKRATAADQASQARQSLEEIERSIAMATNVIPRMKDIVEANPEDASSRNYLEQRKKELVEQKHMRGVLKDKLAQVLAEIREIDSTRSIVQKGLAALATEEENVTKNKDTLVAAVQKCQIQIAIMERSGGWTKSLDRLGVTTDALLTLREVLPQ